MELNSLVTTSRSVDSREHTHTVIRHTSTHTSTHICTHAHQRFTHPLLVPSSSRTSLLGLQLAACSSVGSEEGEEGGGKGGRGGGGEGEEAFIITSWSLRAGMCTPPHLLNLRILCSPQHPEHSVLLCVKMKVQGSGGQMVGRGEESEEVGASTPH